MSHVLLYIFPSLTFLIQLYICGFIFRFYQMLGIAEYCFKVYIVQKTPTRSHVFLIYSHQMIHRSIKDRKDVFQPNVAIFEVERLYLMMACIQTDFNRELIAAFLKQWTIDQYFYLFIKQLIGNCLSRGKNCLINKSNINVSGLTSQIFSMKGHTFMNNISLFPVHM